MGETKTTNMMKQALLLLLIGLALLRAMPQTNEDVYDEEASVGFSNSDSRRGRKAKLTATFDATIVGPNDPPGSDFSTRLYATIEVTQSRSDLRKKRAKWRATFRDFDNSKDGLCPGGSLNWHVHQTTGNGLGDASCGKPVTGGHYDPLYACGPNSDPRRDVTLAINRECTAAVVEDYGCGPDTQDLCEVGDQSGKMGKLDATYNKRTKELEDDFMPDIRKLEGRSLVLHCCDADTGSCSARIACADLK